MDWSQLVAFFSLGAPGGKVLYLAVVAGIAYVVQRVVCAALGRVFDATDIPAASIFINIVRAVIWVFALLAVLEPVFGIQPTAFVAALGVTSVVISLGLQDTVSNVMGGLGLMLGQVVKPGDQVTVGGVSGEVTDVTWRHTLVRDRGGSVEVIPNSVLNKTALTMRTRWSVTDCSAQLALAPDADLDAVTRDIQDTAQRLLRDQLDPAFSVEVLTSGICATGISCTVHLHVVDDAVPSQAVDTLVRALAGRPWLAHLQLAA